MEPHPDPAQQIPVINQRFIFCKGCSKQEGLLLFTLQSNLMFQRIKTIGFVWNEMGFQFQPLIL